MNFTKYLRTTNKNEIDDIIKLLKINNIEHELENYPSNFNSTFNVDINNIEYLLKINDKDFDKDFDKVEKIAYNRCLVIAEIHASGFEIFSKI